MLARTRSIALTGLTAHLVTVEVDISSQGLPKLVWTGLPDTAVRESERRVKTAISNSDEQWPNRVITVGLSPASVRKIGSGFDLAIGVAVLAAYGRIDPDLVRDLVLLGELRLDGQVASVPGVLPAVIGAVQAGFDRVAVPAANAKEAALVPGVRVIAVGSLAGLCAELRGEHVEQPAEPAGDVLSGEPADPLDLVDVVGQQAARYAIEVAAAGGHHVFLSGPPGVGKTMLAERMPGLLPELEPAAALEVTSIHSLLGRLPPGQPLIRRPPFCAPHHSATTAALIGGGSGIPGPGLISLAHRGVLFLDEATEFERRTLDALRQPLEAGRVTLVRSGGVATYPARFQLILAANPCPCARAGRSLEASACQCTAPQIRSYQARISGPLLDRIDMKAGLAPISRAILAAGAAGEPTAAVRARVVAARERARFRLRDTPWLTNAEVPGPSLRRRWPVPQQSLGPLAAEIERGGASTRGIDKAMKLAWTVADLAGRAAPTSDDVEVARSLRFESSPLRLARSA
jgi:magnesium chelatase family protein